MICDLRSRLPLPLLCAIRDCHCFRECLRDSRLAIVDASAIRDLRMRLPSSVIFGPMRGGFLRLHFFWFFSTFGPCGQLVQHFQLFTFRFSGHAGGFSEIPNSQFSIFRALRAALPRIQIVQFSFSGPAGPLQKKAAAKRVVLTQNGELPRGEEGTGGLLYSKLKNRFKKSCTREIFSPFLGAFSVTQACPIPPPNSTAFDSTRPLPTFPHPSRRLEKFLNLGNRHKK